MSPIPVVPGLVRSRPRQAAARAGHGGAGL